MSSCTIVRAVVVSSALAMMLAGGPAVDAAEDPATAQLEFGVKMAKRGLWSEALFRFQQADELRPGSSRILNNIAVAYEALGQFDRALDFYQRAVKVGGDADMRKNYTRFVEFYRNFKPEGDGEDGGDSGAEGSREDVAEDGAGSAPPEDGTGSR